MDDNADDQKSWPCYQIECPMYGYLKRAVKRSSVTRKLLFSVNSVLKSLL